MIIEIDIVFDIDGMYRGFLMLMDERTEFIEFGDIILDWDVVREIFLTIKKEFKDTEIYISVHLEEFLMMQEHYDEGVIPFNLTSIGKLKRVHDDEYNNNVCDIFLGKKKWKKFSDLTKYLSSFEIPKEQKDKKVKGKNISDSDIHFELN